MKVACVSLAALTSVHAFTPLATTPARQLAGTRNVRLASTVIEGIQTDTARERKLEEAAEKQAEEDDKRMSPVEEEATMMSEISGNPKVGVSGLFGDAKRTDQAVLDTLHAQNVWGSIVALAPDVAAAKKRLTSRSARYSGLLNKLEFSEWAASPTDPAAIAAALEADGIEAWVAFGVAPAEVGACLEAAKRASTVSRVVVAVDGTVDAVMAAQYEAASSELTWSLVSIPGGVTDDVVAADATLSIDFVDEAEAQPVARDDACRILAESLAITAGQNRAFSVAYGGANATAYMKSLREAGYTRRGELGKLLAGGLPQWIEEEAKKAAEPKKRKKKLSESDDAVIVVVGDEELSPAMQAQLEERRAEARKERDAKIAEAARIQLKAEYGEKQFTECRAVTEEEYIRYYWNRAVIQQAEFLGYKKAEQFLEEAGPAVRFPDDEEWENFAGPNGETEDNDDVKKAA